MKCAQERLKKSSSLCSRLPTFLHSNVLSHTAIESKLWFVSLHHDSIKSQCSSFAYGPTSVVWIVLNNKTAGREALAHFKKKRQHVLCCNIGRILHLIGHQLHFTHYSELIKIEITVRRKVDMLSDLQKHVTSEELGNCEINRCHLVVKNIHYSLACKPLKQPKFVSDRMHGNKWVNNVIN